MPKKVTKQLVLDLVASLPAGEQRTQLVAQMVARGELSEGDLAALITADVERHAPDYARFMQDDALVRFLAERFRDAPEYLARALVRALPQRFWHYAFAYRMLLRLRADLGPVLIPPWRPGTGVGTGTHPIARVDDLIARDIEALDAERTTRTYLYLFSRDATVARELLAEERAQADAYGQRVLDRVAATFERLYAMEFHGVVPTMRGQPFPAIHVRWWIDQARDIPRVLNIGDTATFKTSFATVGLDHVGARRVLLLCAPNARANHAAEITAYFTNGADRVHALTSAADLPAFIRGVRSHQFSIVGWHALVNPDVVDALAEAPFDAIVADEVQYGKGVSGTAPAKRAIALLRLGKKRSIQRVVACSATPWENRPEELAAVAVLLRPQDFPSPEVFARSGLTATPRILREMFSTHVLDIELREVRDLSDITPKPWEDLFGAVAVPMVPQHRALYNRLREDATPRLPAAKVRLLLQTAIHPPLARNALRWSRTDGAALTDPQTSSKLVWLRQCIAERISRAKICVATGIYATGITRAHDAEQPWIGDILRQWFGEDRVLIVDGTVPIGPHRDAIIARWRTDPNARILLASMQTLPDSINLTVAKSPTVERVWVVQLASAWKPWRQFLGRFHREADAVPVAYITPTLAGTIDEDLLRFNRDKWRVQQLFRANVPLTDGEWRAVRDTHTGGRLREVLRSPVESVNIIGTLMRGRGEMACSDVYASPYGMGTHAEAFAQHFLATERGSTADNVAQFQAKAIRDRMANGMLTPDRICDAACGLLRLERTLGQPVSGVDMNAWMLNLARPHSAYGGRNAIVGRLSALPKEWDGRFYLTVCSIALDWTSLAAANGGEPERVRVLRELARITHPHGLLWLMFREGDLDATRAEAWCTAFRRSGWSVDAHLTGLIRATDGPGERHFACWSLAVAPDGHALGALDPDALRFAWEVGHMRVQRQTRGGRADATSRAGIVHEAFAVEPLGRTVLVPDTVAVTASVTDELDRWLRSIAVGRTVDRTASLSPARLAHLDWRRLQRLVDLGVLQMA